MCCECDLLCVVRTTSRPPKCIKSQPTRRVDEAPAGHGWLQEIKYWVVLLKHFWRPRVAPELLTLGRSTATEELGCPRKADRTLLQFVANDVNWLPPIDHE
jgi:hypothetical protein